MRWGLPWGLAWGAGVAFSQGVIVRGDRSFRLVTATSWGNDALAPSNWTLGGGAREPLVASVAFGDTTWQLDFTSDVALEEGQTITLTSLVDSAGGVNPGPWTFSGMKVSLEPFGAESRELLDIDAPPFEAYRRTLGGDRRLAGGLAVVRKVVHSILSTEAARLYWAPEHGTDLRHKRLLPADLQASAQRIRTQVMAAPRVSDARVRIEKKGAQTVISINVETELGSFADAVEAA